MKIDKVVRYRIYGVVDQPVGESIDPVIEEIQAYGSGCVLDVELVPDTSELPNAEDDFVDYWIPRREPDA